MLGIMILEFIVNGLLYNRCIVLMHILWIADQLVVPRVSSLRFIFNTLLVCIANAPYHEIHTIVCALGCARVLLTSMRPFLSPHPFPRAVCSFFLGVVVYGLLIGKRGLSPSFLLVNLGIYIITSYIKEVRLLRQSQRPWVREVSLRF